MIEEDFRFLDSSLAVTTDIEEEREAVLGRAGMFQNLPADKEKWCTNKQGK